VDAPENQLVAKGESLATMVDCSGRWAETVVPGTYSRYVEIGKKVDVSIPSINSRVKGTIASSDPYSESIHGPQRQGSQQLLSTKVPQQWQDQNTFRLKIELPDEPLSQLDEKPFCGLGQRLRIKIKKSQL